MKNALARPTALRRAAGSSFRFFADTDRCSLHRYHERGALRSLPEDMLLEDVHRPLDELLLAWLLVGDGIAACDADNTVFAEVRTEMRTDPRFSTTSTEPIMEFSDRMFRRVVSMTPNDRHTYWTTLSREVKTRFGAFCLP